MAQITILNQQKVPQGPFTRDEVVQKLQTGEYTLDSWAFIDGLSQWTPLRDVLARVDAAPAAPAYTAPVAAAPVYAAPPAAPAYSAPASVPAASGYSYAATMAPPGHLVYAGFWLRFVAYLIDSLIIGVVVLVISFFIGFAFGLIGAAMGVSLTANNSGDSSGSAGAVLMVLLELIVWAIALALSWLYFAKLESGPEQSTFGKRALGLQVTNLAGQRVSFGQASGRFFGKIVSGLTFYIGFIMAGFTERKQALHDMIAGTLVVRK